MIYTLLNHVLQSQDPNFHRSFSRFLSHALCSDTVVRKMRSHYTVASVLFLSVLSPSASPVTTGLSVLDARSPSPDLETVLPAIRRRKPIEGGPPIGATSSRPNPAVNQQTHPGDEPESQEGTPGPQEGASGPQEGATGPQEGPDGSVDQPKQGQNQSQNQQQGNKHEGHGDSDDQSNTSSDDSDTNDSDGGGDGGGDDGDDPGDDDGGNSITTTTSSTTRSAVTTTSPATTTTTSSASSMTTSISTTSAAAVTTPSPSSQPVSAGSAMYAGKGRWTAVGLIVSLALPWGFGLL